MKIESAQMQLSSARVYQKTQAVSENLQFWVGDRPIEQNPEQKQAVLFDFSKEALSLLEDSATAPTDQVAEVQDENDVLTDEDRMKIRMLEYFLRALTGKKVRLQVPKLSLKDLNSTAYNRSGLALQARPVPQQSGWGLAYDRHESLQEYEKTAFSANGIVKTADGREISLDLKMTMERSYAEENYTSVRAGDALKDPLVINFGGNAAGLSTSTFSFDLDADGRQDQISLLKSGSGFLALDRNDNGIIDNGTELFGPQTDSGFGELRAEDSDGNGWIDENDPIFNKLRIWIKDDSGNDKLLALGEAGVGAIYLGHVSTEFTLRQLEVQGKIRESGIFLKENGQVGTVQELDLKI